MILPLVAAALAGGILTYGTDEPLSEKEDMVVRKALEGGWKLYGEVVGRRVAVPTLVRTNMRLARVGIVRGSNPSTSAEVTWPPGGPYIYIYYDEFVKYDAATRPRIVCHELLHFYHTLPDHYRDPDDRHPGCPMDDFHRQGWSGRLCDDCRRKVNEG